MVRTLEVIFRRLLLLLVILVVPPLVGAAIGYFLPRTYQTTATLWALQRYEIIGATGPETDLNSTPAETQNTALTELLQTRTFALAVATETNLASSLELAQNVRSDPQLLDDALFSEVSRNVQVTSQGYNLFTINYANRDAQMAQKVVAAVIGNYAIQSQGFTIVEGQNLLKSYQAQLIDAQKNALTAVQAEAQYIRMHPNKADLVNDPEYALLHSETQQAQATVTDIQNRIATLKQEISTQDISTASLFKVIDAPQVAGQPVSRMKSLLLAGGIGLTLSLLACILYVLITVRRDRGVYTARDLQRAANLPIVMQLPVVAPKTVSLLIEQSLC